MSVIVSISPWSSFWFMGKGGGMYSYFLSVQTLKKISSEVLNFVEDGSPCDEENIPISVHLKDPIYLFRRICYRLGFFGRYLLFHIRAKMWRSYNSEFFMHVMKELKKRNITSISLVYCHSPLLAECSRKIGKIFGCPVVAHFYGSGGLHKFIGKRNAYYELPFAYLGWITPVDLRIYNDDGSRGLDVARDLGLPLDKFMLQPLGLDIEGLNSQSNVNISKFFRQNKLHVMTASRLVSNKRLDRILKAVPELIRTIRNVHFLILGDGPERQKLEKLAENLGVSKWITFVGPVPREVVFAFMRKCDVYVSTNNIAYGNPVQEAMYFGMCVVATEVGDTNKLIKDGVTGRLFPPDDTMALSRTLIETLLQPETRICLGRAAKTFIEAYIPNQDVIISERIEALTSLMERKK